MGATFNEMKVKGTREEIKRRFEAAQNSDRYENGHSYSGGFGMCDGLVFAQINRVHTEKEAYDWLSDNAQKWGPALAVRLTDDEWMIGAWCSS
jgi:hypothetical protein